MQELGLPVVYVNMVGGQDELVFDGNSFVMDGAGTIVMRAPPFEEGLYPVEFERVDGVVRPVPATVAPELGDAESVYRALVLGVRDYVEQARLSRRRAWACRAASTRRSRWRSPSMRSGTDRVHAVMMPSPLHLADEPRRRARAGRDRSA